MAADVEVKALILYGARYAADIDGVGLQHGDAGVGLAELVGGGQPRGAGADDGDARSQGHGRGVLVVLGIHDNCRSRFSVGT